VTESQITVANVSDISGPVPGIFEDAQLATKAFFAMFARTEGTIYGRKISYLPLDSRLDAGGNRSAYLQACGQAFAAAGSLSGFDQGAAPVVQSCGIPDIRAFTTTDQLKAVPNTYPVLTSGAPGDRSLGQYAWQAQAFPEAVKHAAYLYIDGDVTRQVAEQDIAATESRLGYRWIYKQGIAVTEISYTSFVLNLKEKGVRYVTLVGPYQQAAHLATEMRRQGFTPEVYQPTATAYTPDYLRLAGPAAEGSIVALSGSLFAEAQGNRELQDYLTWLGQVAPGKNPTLLGQYAWGAARLFTEAAKRAGPQLTREKLLAELAKVSSFSSNGMLPDLDVGGKKVNDCSVFVQVRGGAFVRVHPSTGRRCGDGVVNTL
jgi:ABC-type branched-subunit amino acid transport system substrate-binding protein